MATDKIPSSTSSGAIVLYDIGHKPPRGRVVLLAKPVEEPLRAQLQGPPVLDDVVRRGLGEPACRKFADGTEFFTLPMIQDTATGATVGDSFDIAVYLQRTYPDSGAGDLFPAQPLDYTYVQSSAIKIPLSTPADGGFPEYARFNANVDAAFSMHTPLMVGGMPFDPATVEETKAEFVRRAGLSSWDDFTLTREAREGLTESFRAALGDLAKLFLENTDGPFLLGQQPSYADLIVGAWLRMSQMTLPKSEWEEVRRWHGGVFGQLHDALDTYAEVK
ncbi:hypothetical protein TrVGV298_007385 [Trichoderma virens]|nr:hypothetical protein TrVGV298_007385 [Trichoderma virens]